MGSENGKFESWAILELMGHQRIAGMVSEVTMGSASMLRVDVPEVIHERNLYEAGKIIPGFTKIYSTAAVYAITPCSEETAKAAVKSFQSRPFTEFDILRMKALPGPAPEVDDAPDDDYRGD